MPNKALQDEARTLADAILRSPIDGGLVDSGREVRRIQFMARQADGSERGAGGLGRSALEDRLYLALLKLREAHDA